MSEMQFVPIPTDVNELYRLRSIWGPFIPGITRRSGESEQELFDQIINGRVQIGLVWDGKQAHALIGILYRKSGHELVGEVHWVTGFGVKDWQHLLPELERYLKQQVGCTVIKPICRPGWKPLLKKAGYKQTHVMMEKRLS